MNTFTVFVNDESVFDYDKDATLDEQKLAFLDKMDADMDRGIKIKGEMIASPDIQQRTSFVAMNLLKALQQDNDAAIAVSCAYLAKRRLGLTEVHFNDHENSVKIEFVNEELQ